MNASISPSPAPTEDNSQERTSIWNYLALGLFIFLSITPGFGETGYLVTSVGSYIFVLAFMHRPDRQAAISLLFFLAMIAPITFYDLAISLNGRFTTLSFVAIPVATLMGFTLSQSTGKTPYIEAFERVFLPLSVASLFLYAVFFLYPDIAYYLPEYEYRDTFNRTAFLLNIRMDPDPVLRNAGFASEPGFYQIFVNAALYSRLRRLGRPDIWCFFYILVVITTTSTAGFVVSTVLLAAKLKTRHRIFLAAVALIFLNVIEDVAATHWDSKVQNDAVFGPRFYPSINAFWIFVKNPLGIGAVEYQRVYEGLDIGSWDAYTQIALRYGIPGLAAFAVFLFLLGRRYFSLLLVFGLSFITSPIWFLPAIAAFYFPGLSEQKYAQTSDLTSDLRP